MSCRGCCGFSKFKLSLVLMLTALLLFAGGGLKAQSPSDEKLLAEQEADGRYAVTKTDQGFIRLDRETGRVSICSQSRGEWLCRPAPDAEMAMAREIDDLVTKNLELSTRNRELEVLVAKLKGEDMRPSLSPQDEENIGQALDLSEKVMRRFFEMMRSVQKDYFSEPEK